MYVYVCAYVYTYVCVLCVVGTVYVLCCACMHAFVCCMLCVCLCVHVVLLLCGVCSVYSVVKHYYTYQLPLFSYRYEPWYS